MPSAWNRPLKGFALAMAFLRLAAATSPAVTKVEPPDWPVEPGGITLRVLLTGTGLAGATVHSAFPTGAAAASAAGTHLFFDLTIPASAHPGRYPLRVTTSGRTVEANFGIVPALAPTATFPAGGRTIRAMPSRRPDGPGTRSPFSIGSNG